MVAPARENSVPIYSNPQSDFFNYDNLSDNELLEKMFANRNGYNIRSLFSGNTSGHYSHSEADITLVSHLSYWTNGDAVSIDALFRQSGLMREKWNEKYGTQTYGEIIISKVLSNFSPFTPFTPKVQ